MPTSLAFAVTFFNIVSLRASRVLVTLYALKLGAEPITVGILAAVFSIFPVLFSWHAGRTSDYYGPRWPLAIAAAGSALSLALPFFVPTLTALFIATVLHGTASTYFNVSIQNLIGMLSDAKNRARNYGNYAIVVSVGTAAGPLFAGLSIDHLGHQATFLYVAAVLFLPAPLLMIWGAMLPGRRRDPEPAHSVRDMIRNPRMWPVLVASAIAQAGLEVFYVYLPVYGDAHGLSASAIGVILAVSAVGAVMGRIMVTQWTALASEEKVLAQAQFIGGLCLLIVPLFNGITALCIVSLVFGFGLNCTQPVALTLMYSRSPKGRAGEALGLRFTVDSAARLVGPLLFGVVASTLGLGALFWLSALMMGAGGTISQVDAVKNHNKSGGV